MDNMEITRLIETIIRKEEKHPPAYQQVTATLQFTEEECGRMGEEIGYWLLKRYERCVRITKRQYPDKTIYIIRLRRGGFCIEVEHENIEEAKRLFIQKTWEVSEPKSILLAA